MRIDRPTTGIVFADELGILGEDGEVMDPDPEEDADEYDRDAIGIVVERNASG